MTIKRALLLLLFSEFVEDDLQTGFISDEKNLIQFILKRYEEIGIVGRPVSNATSLMNVYYGMGLIQILNLDEKNQILTTNVWCRYTWRDEFLIWNPDLFGGVQNIRVPAHRVWTPDIELYNYADTRIQEHREAMVVVSHDGSVLWIPPAIFKSTCSIDITNFPFDVQECNMKFGSWTYDGLLLDINFYQNFSEVDTSDYVHSNEWALVAHPARKNIVRYACCDEPYVDLTFTVILRRVPQFYNYILVLPCVLLSFLTLVIFWLPPESPAKILLGMNIFVAFFVLLLLLAESTPPAASSIPLIGKYFCVNMILITLSSFLAIMVITTHIRGDRRNKVPVWLQKIAINYLARVLCMKEFLDDSSQANKKRPEKTPDASENRAPKKPGRREASSSSRSRNKRASNVTQTAGGDVSVTLYPQPSGGKSTESLSGLDSRSYGATGSSQAPGGQPVVLDYRPYPLVSASLVDGNCGGARPQYSVQSPCGLETNTQQGCLYQYQIQPSPAKNQPNLLTEPSAQYQFGSTQSFHYPSVTSKALVLHGQGNGSTPPVLDYRDAIPPRGKRSSSAGREQQGGDEANMADKQPQTSGGLIHIEVNKSVQNDVREIKRLVRAYVARLQDKESQAKVTKEWRIVARVIDRLFFLFYVSTIVFSLATIFPRG